MADLFLDMAADFPVPILSGTHNNDTVISNIVYLLDILRYCLVYYSKHSMLNLELLISFKIYKLRKLIPN